MSEEPMEPVSPPEIPRKTLWALLLIPPGVTFLLGLLAGESDFMVVVPLVGTMAIFYCQGEFMAVMTRRYRGRSMVLMGFFFFVGQVVICLSLWFGACLTLHLVS